jgi:DHA1 family multidrug resistance protein-like MFS transporter
MLGPVVGTATVLIFGRTNTFFIASLVALPSIFLTMALTGKTRGYERSTGKLNLEDIRSTLANRNILVVALAFFSFHYAFESLSTYAPLQVKFLFAVPDSTIVLLFLGYTTVAFLSRLALNKSEWMDLHASLLLLSLLTSAASLFLASLSPFFWLFFVSFILMGISKGLVFPVTSVSVAESSSLNSRMLANAVYLLPVDCGALVGPLVGSFLAGNYGISLALSISAVVPILGLSLILIAARE